MLFNLLKTCLVCKKMKFSVKKRTFYCKPLNTTLTSQNPMCRGCVKLYKNVNKQN